MTYHLPQPPRPGRKWEGVRLANERGIECIHYDYILDRGIRGQEDCLILNVFTPAIKVNNFALRSQKRSII